MVEDPIRIESRMDEELLYLLTTTELYGVETPITVSFGSLVVAGSLTSKIEYVMAELNVLPDFLQRQAERESNTGNYLQADDITADSKRWKNRYSDEAKSYQYFPMKRDWATAEEMRVNVDRYRPEQLRFIYMKRATLAGGTELIHLPYWKGKLYTVTGWALGRDCLPYAGPDLETHTIAAFPKS